MLADNGSGPYKLLLVLHILSAIVGLGAVMLNGLYAAQAARRPRALGLAVSEANLAVQAIVIAVPRPVRKHERRRARVARRTAMGAAVAESPGTRRMRQHRAHRIER